MHPRRRRRQVAAVVGLLAGMALLLGAVLDGGLATPTRTDPVGAVAAVPHGDVHGPSAQPREDHPAWGHTLSPSRIAVLVAGLVGIALAVAATARPAPGGSHHRAPALLAARHRGPPSLV
jgi:hypothetical protein